MFEHIKELSGFISTIVLIFWAGYTYRRIQSHQERIQVLQTKNKEICKIMTEGFNNCRDYSEKLIKNCSANKVYSQDLTVLSTKIDGLASNQVRFDKQLNHLANKFDAFTEYYYKRNRKNNDGG